MTGNRIKTLKKGRGRQDKQSVRASLKSGGETPRGRSASVCVLVCERNTERELQTDNRCQRERLTETCSSVNRQETDERSY